MGLHLCGKNVNGIVSLWEELRLDCIFMGGIKMGFESWAEISSQWVHSGHHNVQPVTKDFQEI